VASAPVPPRSRLRAVKRRVSSRHPLQLPGSARTTSRLRQPVDRSGPAALTSLEPSAPVRRGQLQARRCHQTPVSGRGRAVRRAASSAGTPSRCSSASASWSTVASVTRSGVPLACPQQPEQPPGHRAERDLRIGDGEPAGLSEQHDRADEQRGLDRAQPQASRDGPGRSGPTFPWRSWCADRRMPAPDGSPAS
jgi:hypothetical protein